MQKVKGNAIRTILIRTLLLLMPCYFQIAAMDVQAAGEKGRFGSESYEWKLEEECSIGVYAQSDQDIDSVEMYVAYDQDVLEYRSGGELTEEGLVKVTASGVRARECKEMLQFVPKLSGNTQVIVKNILIRNAAGEDVQAEDISVPVNIAIEEGCALQGIQVNGQAVNGFVPDTTRYDMEVAEDVEEAEITVTPADAEAEISNTSLAPGRNTIHIITTNREGRKARYTLNINKPELQKQEAEQEETTEHIQSEPTVIMEKKKGSAMVNRILIGILIVMLMVIFAMLIVIKWQMVQRNKRRRLREEARTGKKGLAERSSPEDNGGGPGGGSGEGADTLQSEQLCQEKDETFADEELEIAVKNVTMEFKREKDESTSIKELLIRTIKRQRTCEIFRALDNVSFNIRKGEVVGIIGTNGSGKSTILKIISGALIPTEGKVDVNRKKIQLLTLGTGFDFELTGRENVYLNGAVIGYTKEYIDEKYDEIVEFAELEGFMEEKVRNYSSGMVSRLGFAIATISDAPEILILDEVLSVGDMFFRKKSEARIKELIHGGSTVLIVSHSTSVIKDNCTRAVWIEKGVLRAVGKPEDVCAEYEKMNENT